MRAVFAMVISVVALCGAASAQQNDAVLEHYRAYRGALEGGDLQLAAREAELALAASEAASGGGGRTAVLSFNLATARVNLGDWRGARSPAARALALSESGASGVDPAYAGLILGRTELALSERVGADRLATVLAGDLSALPPGEVYLAAAELGAWAHSESQFERAAAAWRVAAAHASESPFGESMGLARAQTWQAAAMFMNDIGADGGRRRSGHLSAPRAHEIYMMLSNAIAALRPLSEVDDPSIELTLAQTAYAQALVWEAAVRAKVLSDGGDLPEAPPEAQGAEDGLVDLASRNLTQPRCQLDRQITGGFRRFYPEVQLGRGAIGAVAVHVRLDGEGQVIGSRAVATIGNDAFAEAAENLISRMRFTRTADSQPDCRMPSDLLLSVNFGISRERPRR